MHLIKRGKKGTYHLRYRVGGRDTTESLHTSNKKEAERILKLKEAELVQGRFKIRPKQMFFQDYAEEYIEWCISHNKGVRDKRRQILWFARRFRNFTLDAITPEMILKAQTELVQLNSHATSNRYLAALKHMYTTAIERGYVHENPVKKVKLFRERPTEINILTEHEIESLVDACCGERAHIRPVVICALNTGMRISEIFGLKWDNVKLERRHLRATDTKTGEDREIPINETLYEALKNIERVGDYVFTFRGRSIKRITRSFTAAKKAAGITKHIRIHDRESSNIKYNIFIFRPLHY